MLPQALPFGFFFQYIRRGIDANAAQPRFEAGFVGVVLPDGREGLGESNLQDIFRLLPVETVPVSGMVQQVDVPFIKQTLCPRVVAGTSIC